MVEARGQARSRVCEQRDRGVNETAAQTPPARDRRSLFRCRVQRLCGPPAYPYQTDQHSGRCAQVRSSYKGGIEPPPTGSGEATHPNKLAYLAKPLGKLYPTNQRASAERTTEVSIIITAASCRRPAHPLVPDTSLPPANEAIRTGGAGTIGRWQVAPWRTQSAEPKRCH